MKTRFDRAKTIDWSRMNEAKTTLLGQIQRYGAIDLKRLIQDATMKGALAELEFSGHVRAKGLIGLDGNAEFEVANDEAQRAEFRRMRVERDSNDYRRHNSRATAKVSDRDIEANRAKVDEFRKKIADLGRDA